MISTPQSFRLVVLVSGRGSNLQALIDAQNQGKIKSKIVGVISNKPGGLALSRATDATIPTKVVPSKGKKSAAFFAELEIVVDEFRPDLIVLAGFMKILPPDFVARRKNRIINIHPSLLPNFPGLDAQKQAIEAGAKQTGCTVHYVDEGCDTGPIILQKTESILPRDSADSLSERLLEKEHACLIEAIQLIENNKVLGQEN